VGTRLNPACGRIDDLDERRQFERLAQYGYTGFHVGFGGRLTCEPGYLLWGARQQDKRVIVLLQAFGTYVRQHFAPGHIWQALIQ
jgi:hypothetical protein